MTRIAALSRSFGVAATLAIVGAASPVSAQSVQDPVAQAKARIEQSCLKAEYGEDFAKWSDINGDGRDDVIITYHVTCDGYNDVFCGRDGCEGAVFVEDGLGGYFDTGLPPDLVASEWKGWPAVTIRTHGSDCGLSGPRACKSLRVWDGSAFVRPTNAMARGKPENKGALAAGLAEDDASMANLTGDEQAELQRLALANPTTSYDVLLDRIVASRPIGFEPDPETGAATETITVGGASAELSGAARRGGQSQDRVEQRYDAQTAALDGDPLDPDAANEQTDENASEEEPDPLQQKPNADAWIFSQRLDGGFAAEILGQDGAALLRLACAPGDPSFSLVFKPSRSRAVRPGTLVLTDYWVGRRISQSRLMTVERDGVWRDAIQPYGSLISDLRRGVWLVLSEPGDRTPLGQFALSGSSRAIGDLAAACRL